MSAFITLIEKEKMLQTDTFSTGFSVFTYPDVIIEKKAFDQTLNSFFTLSTDRSSNRLYDSLKKA